MKTEKQQAVVLVHGLYMKPWTWWSYRNFFSDHGYQVYVFGYKTTGQPFDLSVMQLVAFINSRREETVHLVAHSMGGILSMQTLPKVNKSGKLVMLGSPINGSIVAKKLHKKGWQKILLKHAYQPLAAGVVEPKKTRKTLMIAGTSPYGFGRLFEHKLGPSDGTVRVVETEAEWLDGHKKIHTNHIGLLKNKTAMQLTLDFLSSE